MDGEGVDAEVVALLLSPHQLGLGLPLGQFESYVQRLRCLKAYLGVKAAIERWTDRSVPTKSTD